MEMKCMWDFSRREKAVKGEDWWLSCYWNKEPKLAFFFSCLILKKLFINKILNSFMSQFPHLLNGNNRLSKCLDILGLKGQVSLEWKYICFLLLRLRAPWSKQATEQRWWPLSCREWTARWQSPFNIMTLTVVVCNLWSSLLIIGAVGCRRAHSMETVSSKKRKKKKNRHPDILPPNMINSLNHKISKDNSDFSFMNLEERYGTGSPGRPLLLTFSRKRQ